MVDVDDLHTLAVRATTAGLHAWCRCGSWEGWWSGPAGKAMVLDDYDHHRRAASNGVNLPPVQ
jgi:hypothetical protein